MHAQESASSAGTTIEEGVTIGASLAARYDEILTAEAARFVADLERRFGEERHELLAARQTRQTAFDAGELPDFLEETAEIRSGDWTIAGIPADLQDRRVEITGPVDRKMIINALNSGANVFMADFEDASSPFWANMIEGQINLKDAVRREIDFTDSASGKAYRLNEDTAVLLVRPRGWHLPEDHFLVDGSPVSASLFDFGLYFFHNAAELLRHGTGPYFYLPKLESHREARLWAKVFGHAEEALGIGHGSIKVTVLIETITAAFEMHEILYELKDYIVGLNCGRWDYIFSFIKRLRNHADLVLPDRSRVTMDKAFLRAYSRLLIQTCHRRGAHAMGGMAAQIPIKDDPAADEAAKAKVIADKEREAGDGHDGTWVAHPGQVAVAKSVFDRLMPEANQIQRRCDEMTVGRDDLLRIHEGDITETGVRDNIRVGVQYLAAWLGGRGAVPLYHLMEDAATAEICRAQIWQWIHHEAQLADGRPVTRALVEAMLEEEMTVLKDAIGAERFEEAQLPAAITLFKEVSMAPEFEEFLTLPAYRHIVSLETE